jgi:hypothetical protein
MFQNRVLRIFGPKRKEVPGGWRRLYNEELHNLYSSPNIIRVINLRIWAGYVAFMGKVRNAYKILIGKPEGKRLHGRPRCRWKDNVKLGLREIWWEGVDWIHLAQYRDQ